MPDDLKAPSREREDDPKQGKTGAGEQDQGNADAGKDDKDSPPSPEDDRKRRRRRAITFIVAGIVLIALIVAGVLYYLDSRHYETTDDAQIDGHVTQMAAQISGRVLTLNVGDNEHVVAGQLLLTIDPRDVQVRLAQAEAQEANAQASVTQAEAQIGVQRASVEQARANVQVSQADLTQAEQDAARFNKIDARATTRQQVDNANATLASAKAKLEANKRAVDGAQAQVTAAEAQLRAAQASLRSMQASTATQRLQLAYANVTAPAAGRIARRTVEVGNYINPGQALLAIVQDDIWVTANFKETQLGLMRVGQRVRVRVDSCSGVDFSGRIDSFQNGTGAVFSMLPAENATGNYVKVVQRVPTKITFDGPTNGHECQLGPGMSVTPRVTVRN